MAREDEALESWMRSKRLMSSLGRGHRKSTAKQGRQLAGVLLYRTLRATWRELETELRDGLRHR
jgi:hypothetical protein